ncbi:MAG: glycosyltransferase [Cyanobacteria bacterium P01_B01_bin.77]
MKSLKVLVSAYACKPNMGSEPGVGWHIVQELAKHHQVWVLTREENRDAIERFRAQNATKNLTFVYCDPPGPAKYLKHAQVPHYYFWQMGAYTIAKRLHRQITFDIAHHVTYVRYSTPSFLTLLPIPFIWGPVGGGESTPSGFWQDFSLRAKVYEFLRTATHRVGEIDPFAQVTARRSALARATTQETAQRLQLMGASNVQTCSALGLSQSELSMLEQFSAPRTNTIRFISIARLLHWKGLHLSLRAFAQANLNNDIEYWILGDGPERDTLTTLAHQLKIGSRVKFLGALPRQETLQQLANCYALIHPSLHDSGGLVCLEAMAAGRPVICLDTGGPATQITDKTGIKVPVKDPQQAIADLAEAIATLASNPNLCVRMSQAGQQHVRRHFSWETKGKQLAQLYVELASQS